VIAVTVRCGPWQNRQAGDALPSRAGWQEALATSNPPQPSALRIPSRIPDNERGGQPRPPLTRIPGVG